MFRFEVLRKAEDFSDFIFFFLVKIAHFDVCVEHIFIRLHNSIKLWNVTPERTRKKGIEGG